MDHKELLLSESAKNQLDMVKEYKLNHDYSGALKIYLSIFTNGFTYAPIAAEISLCYIYLSDFGQAKKWIEKAIDLDDRENYYVTLAIIYEMEYDFENEISILRKVLQENPNNSSALKMVIGLYFPFGDYFDPEFIKQCLLTLINNRVEDIADYTYHLAKIEILLGEYSSAKSLLEEVVIYSSPTLNYPKFELREMLEEINKHL
ncbi:hypothetical protein JR338_03885 [Chloroflexota bacterium]|nr:hypothetical protein JR338_03885 [Chloroflexota bacterium]